jgi:hypothetical protein
MRTHALPRAAALAALLALAACGRDDTVVIPHDAAQLQQVRAYEVPVHRAAELQTALNNLFAPGAKDGRPSARAWRVGESRLLVLAPAATHPSIAEALDDVLKDGGEAPPPRPPAPVRLTFWIVDADPSATTDDPRLAALADVLDAARAGLGAAHFTLEDTVSISMLSDGAQARAETGRGTEATARLEPDRGGHVADIGLSARHGGRLQTRVPMRHGEYTVLAQLSTDERPDRPARTRLLVLRSDAAAD